MASVAETSTLVVGIDFGTTFSGVAYAYCGGNAPPGHNDIHLVLRWPENQASNSDQSKVPSLIYYNPEARNISWGYNIPEGATPIEWFKLLLLDEKDLPDYLKTSKKVKDAGAELRRLRKDAVDVIGDYLRLLWDATLGDAVSTYGTLINGSVVGRKTVGATPIHVVFTVPAIWKPEIREKMLTAAERAGIFADRNCSKTTWSFVSEPEAAALATLHSDIKPRPDLRPGDAFTILDCGGGTVDTISYQIESMDPWRIRECAKGDGALAGAIFLDQAFVRILKQTVGKNDWDKLAEEDIQDALEKYWERSIKPRFNNSTSSYQVKLGGKEYSISKVHVKTAFKAVIPDIELLVESQIDAIKELTSKRPKFVILVGGFGRCRYIQQALNAHSALRRAPVIEVLQAASSLPWTAICRGAVLHGASCLKSTDQTGQAVLVQSRKARASFGFTYIANWDVECRSQFPLEIAEMDEVRGQLVVRDAILWMVKEGEDVDARFESYDIHATFAPGTVGIGTVASKLVYFTGPVDSLPSRFVEGIDHLHVAKVVELRTPEPVEELPTTENAQNDECPTLEYQWHLEVSGESMVGTPRRNGRRIGQSTSLIASQYN